MDAESPEFPANLSPPSHEGQSAIGTEPICAENREGLPDRVPLQQKVKALKEALRPGEGVKFWTSLEGLARQDDRVDDASLEEEGNKAAQRWRACSGSPSSC